MKAVVAALAVNRYGELEKAIQREADPDKRKLLERDLLRSLRYGDRTR